MIKVVGISFKENGQVYFFSPNNLNIKKGDKVIVESENITQFSSAATDIIEIDESKLKSPLKNVVRIATKKDIESNAKNIKDAKNALIKAKSMVKKYNLNMQLIDASYSFNRDQLTFKFLSDNRIDFRDFVKELASVFHTRIELRQIGARDKSKEIGGCGLCGRPLCCSTFLKDLDSVSIGMAKHQNLSLNPSKINGLCGRLMCCLKYEDKCYCEMQVGLPKVGKKVKINEGTGTVVNVDILKQKYTVNVENVGYVDVELNNGNN